WEVLPAPGGPLTRKGLNFGSFSDGTSNTFLVVEAADPVIWTKPDDVPFDGKQVPRFGGGVKNGFNAAMADGDAVVVSSNAPPEDLLAAITRNGGETPPANWRDPTQSVGPTPTEARVQGKVTYQGRPLPGGTITFHRSTGLGQNVVGLFLQPDGSFQAARMEPGKYRVSVVVANAPAGFPKLPQRYA